MLKFVTKSMHDMWIRESSRYGDKVSGFACGRSMMTRGG